jgi:hypothetical protein
MESALVFVKVSRPPAAIGVFRILHGQLVVSAEEAFKDIVNGKSQIHVRWQLAVRVYCRPERPVPVVLSRG